MIIPNNTAQGQGKIVSAGEGSAGEGKGEKSGALY